MATTPNQKPVPSEDYVNMRFNAGKFDEFMTSTASSYVDRLGITHLTVKGIQASVAGALLPANNLSDVQSAATSRTNLGATTIGSSVFTATSAANARTALGVTPANIGAIPVLLTNFTDANAVLTTGLYACGASATNTPINVGGVLEHFTHTAAGNYVQVYHVTTVTGNANANRHFFRTFDTTWSAWVEYATGGANSNITSLTGLTTPLSTAQGGTGNATGLAATATALATARTFSTNLASTTAASFNGTANVTPGVTGTLPITNGGTGGTTAAAARTSLGAAASAGVTNGSSAAAGVVGEILTAQTASALSITSSTITSVISLTLTAGDWDIEGNVYFSPASSTITRASVCLTTTNGTTMESFFKTQHYYSSTNSLFFQPPLRRLQLSSSTVVYLTVLSDFTGGTLTSIGSITARRAR